jgi:monoamine oxidase
MRTLAALVLVALSATVAHADKKMAAEFLRRHPELRGFDPAKAALLQEVKQGQLKRPQAKQMLAAARRETAVKHPVSPFAPVVPPDYSPETMKRQARMQRAARRRMAWAQTDAAGASYAQSAVNAAWAEARQFTPHYR